jgi:hypothetical protein
VFSSSASANPAVLSSTIASIYLSLDLSTFLPTSLDSSLLLLKSGLANRKVGCLEPLFKPWCRTVSKEDVVLAVHDAVGTNAETAGVLVLAAIRRTRYAVDSGLNFMVQFVWCLVFGGLWVCGSSTSTAPYGG